MSLYNILDGNNGKYAAPAKLPPRVPSAHSQPLVKAESPAAALALYDAWDNAEIDAIPTVVDGITVNVIG